MKQNLFNKVWEKHKVGTLKSGMDQLFIGLHLIHEVTSPQAFAMLAEEKLQVLYPDRTFATVDHIIPTTSHKRPFADDLADKMFEALEKNTKKWGIQFFNINTGMQGIVHIIGPELGLTQPGLTIACGDSHTSTHGALGAIAFGVGTSQIKNILATQTLALNKPKVRKIEINGNLADRVYAKDIILRIIADLGVKGGIGYAYEYSGSAISNLDIEQRCTICNMSIEGGARVGYINPDQKTFDYIKGRKFAPADDVFDKAVKYWKEISSDDKAAYDDICSLQAESIEPMISWGINPGQSIGISQKIPAVNSLNDDDRDSASKALSHMGFAENQIMIGKKIDVAFIGSCTNGRISDLKEAAKIIKGKKVKDSVRALVVPGSQQVQKQAEESGLDKVFAEAGFQWRNAGCSMCLGMNPDQLKGNEISASSSNRNFIGRQGSAKGRTLLMSPAMVAAAACAGEIVDIRNFS